MRLERKWYRQSALAGRSLFVGRRCFPRVAVTGKLTGPPSGLARLIPRNTPKRLRRTSLSSHRSRCFSRDYSPSYLQFPHRLGIHLARNGVLFYLASLCYASEFRLLWCHLRLKGDLNRRLLAHRLCPESNAAALSYSRKEETSCLAPIDRTLLVTPV
jgi:hypothetical protein